MISYELMVSLNDSIIKELSNITDTFIILTDLDYEAEYDLSITATNCVGRGEAAFITPTINIGKDIHLIVVILFLKPRASSKSHCFSAGLLITEYNLDKTSP